MRLIDADNLQEGIACHKQYTDQEYETDRQWALGYNAGIERALFSITYAHTIDAEPVRHGRWIRMDDTFTKWQCSACGAIEDHSGWLYCHCGARMDGGLPQSIGFTTGGAKDG